jgi:hypothetical protein
MQGCKCKISVLRPEGVNAPMATLRDPRPSRFARMSARQLEECDLPVPRFTVDEHYTGPVPPRMVTFFRLNNNIDEEFLRNEVYSRVPGANQPSEIEKIRVYWHENRHLGLGKVTFRAVQLAKLCANEMDGVSIMGSKIGKAFNLTVSLKLLQFFVGNFVSKFIESSKTAFFRISRLRNLSPRIFFGCFSYSLQGKHLSKNTLTCKHKK